VRRAGAASWPWLALFFASGAVALVYEVLWLKELSLLFGSTARSAAITLTVFFLGLSLGNWFFGKRAEGFARPIRVYALLEVGVAAAALAYFVLLDAYFAIYAGLFQSLRDWPGALTLLKIVLSIGLLLPASFCMGGTLPLLAQHLIGSRDEIGRTGTLLYALNTAGGAVGVLLAGFYLPPLLGYHDSYLAAIAANLAIAAFAWALGGAPAAVTAETNRTDRTDRTDRAARTATAIRDEATERSEKALLAVAAVSGFAALGLEVLWTRMFAQVLHNSVYSFSLILVTFLVVLALGAVLAREVLRRVANGAAALVWLLTSAGLAVGLTPFVFYAATNGLGYVAPTGGFASYLWTVFGLAGGVLLAPGILVGSVFPLALSLTRAEGGAGRIIGRLASVNTVGAIAGSLVAGLVLLEWLGLWASMRAIAILYLATALLVADRLGVVRPFFRVAPLAVLVLLTTLADAARLPILPELKNAAKAPAVHRVWEGRDGTVAVVSVGGDLRTLLDTYYSLGGTEKKQYEETQGDLPLLVHPNPRSVFFLGLGTGITAGAALGHRVDRVVVAEINPNVVEASRTYYEAHLNGLFEDPRAEVVVEDGRQYLMGTDERFDVAVSDLFIPWQAGAGSLYAKEHFEAVRDRLAPGGIFAQWLPLYQLSQGEVDAIAHTMLEVFPHVTLWRGDFLPDRPIVALIASNEPQTLDPEALVQNYRHRRKDPSLSRDSALGLLGMFYAGNLGEARELFSSAPVNTDDLPLLEYGSPVTHRRQRAGEADWLTSRELIEWYRRLRTRVPADEDPYLARLDARERGFTDAGFLLLDAQVSLREGKREAGEELLADFARHVPREIAARFQTRKQAAPTSGNEASTKG